MKLAYRHFSALIETSEKTVGGVVIENPRMLYQFLTDMQRAVDGMDAGIVVSQDDKVLDIPKTAELLTDFVQFGLNQKGLLAKIISAVDRMAENERFYNASQQLLACIENHIMEMTVDMPCELVCEKLSMQNLIKAVGLSIVDEYDSLEERILAYMDLARDFLGKRLFVFVNIRGYIPPEYLQKMTGTALQREHEMIFIDNREYPKLLQEQRLIIDEDLCEI